MFCDLSEYFQIQYNLLSLPKIENAMDLKVFTQISKRLLKVELQRLISCQVLNSSLGVVVSLLLYDGKLNIFGLWTK